MLTDEQTRAGQAVYTPLALRFYDLLVLGVSNRFLWRCPTRHLESLYQRNVSARHLDIGVGTGYFLDKVSWPVASPAISLADINANALTAAANRIARYQPACVVVNALEPMAIDGRFDSIGLNYLLHCLPGDYTDKAVVFDHIGPLMSEEARVFGATIVQGDAPRSAAAQALMNFYNRKGIFSNSGDTQTGLEKALRKRFCNVRLQRHGAVVLFEAWNRPHTGANHHKDSRKGPDG